MTKGERIAWAALLDRINSMLPGDTLECGEAWLMPKAAKRIGTARRKGLAEFDLSLTTGGGFRIYRAY